MHHEFIVLRVVLTCSLFGNLYKHRKFWIIPVEFGRVLLWIF